MTLRSRQIMPSMLWNKARM
uniref:Uncharacterized protein n=1 Tax=Anguilla anguilla TaxID=7936 RepID=A0A0E9UF70_ANGAN